MKRGLVGFAKISFLVLALAAVVSFAVLNLGAVFALHDVIVTVSPNMTGNQSSQLITFNVTVYNNITSSDSVSEFRIEYQLLNFSQFQNVTCLPKVGWSGPTIIHITNDGNACLYIADNDVDTIKGGQSSIFQFTAYPPETECCRVLNFEVRGVNFDWEPKIADICVDPIPPLTIKTYGDPHFPAGINDPATPYPHYISSSTPITLTASDSMLGLPLGTPGSGKHDTGIDKTWWYDQIVGDDNCTSKEACQLIACPPYKECICPDQGTKGGPQCVKDAQTYCSSLYDRETQLQDWANCTEFKINNDCVCEGDYWHLYQSSGPFQKPTESCHIIQFFSVDGVGNIEPMNTQCVFVDNTPPVRNKEVGNPKIIIPDDLEQLGGGKAEWTTSEKNTGSYSAKLTIPANAAGTDFAGVDSQLTNFVGLDTINSLSYYRKVTQYDNGWTPIIILGIDANGDGKFDAKPLEWEASLSAGAVNASLLGSDSFIQCEAQTGLTSTDANFVKVDAYSNFACYTPKADGTDYDWSVYQPLSYFKTNNVGRVHTTDKIAMVKVELGGNPTTQDNEIAYVDTVELNGDVIIDEPTFWWVGGNTGITLNCTDQQPHPVNNNDVCYKVSFDLPEPMTDITGQYCDPADMDKGWCCVPSPKVVTFKEDSLHNLEFFCRDALGNKEQTTDLEYFKVDAQPPVITKTIDGPSSGQCPPQQEGDKCYIDGVTKIHVNATDPEPHPVDNIKCEWYYILDDSQKIFGGDDQSPPFDINFPEESKHELHIKCWDALKNKAEDVETFYVDKTPPVTTKTYGQPFYANSANWINSSTPITLTVDDAGPHKSGIKETLFRVTLMDGDNPCMNDDSCQSQTGTGNFLAYTAPFMIGEDSCHLIEYYSIDNVNKTEIVKKRCVFVDNTPPKTDKIVGEPKVACQAPVDNNQCQGGKTYTVDADFDLGVLLGLNHNPNHDQLQLTLNQKTTFPVMWVANAGEDSVSKWDTTNMKELARYRTWFGPLGSHSPWGGPAPSRTAVDSDGNVYVANRHFDGKPADVFKILANDYIDRNGNGVMDTSSDLNSDGYIQVGEMAPEMTDSNSNGKIDPTEITDERVAWVTQVGPSNCLGRSLAIDLNGNIWLGCYNTETYFKLDGTTGAILAGPISVAPNTPYGALVDKYGILWGASLDGYLLRLDTNTNAVTTYVHSGGDYGIALGYDNSGNTHVYLGSGSGQTYFEFNSATNTFSTPAALSYYSEGLATDKNGNIVVGDASTGGVAKFALNGSVIWNAASQVGVSDARGSVVDSDGNVWVIYVSSNKIAKYNGSDGTPLGVRNSGLGPYTYSDAAGLGFAGSVSSGTWNVIYDSGAQNSTLGPVSWNSVVPENTTLTVRVRSSNDKIAWSPWEIVSNGVPLSTTPNGQYLEVEVAMKSTVQDTPVLYDLTVQGGCGAPTTCWFVNQQTPITLNCNDQQPHPVDNSKIWYRYRTSDDCKTWGEWTQWTDPAILDTVAEVTKTFTFPEDSCHELEYYCVDALGNKENTQSEIDIVDTQPPVITTSIVGPSYVKDEKTYIDTVTKIHVEASDPDPHPVNSVKCEWYYILDDSQKIFGGDDQAPPFDITFPEETKHELHIKCWDALKNKAEVVETYYADHTPPVTTKTYGDPFYSNGSADWITSSTPITLTIDDAGPHKTGIKATYYRVTQLGSGDENNAPCLSNDICQQQTGTGDFLTYTDPFTIGQESCHLIEYYSVDNVNKTETIKKQCVFVDNTDPNPVKTVGDPKTQWDGKDAVFYDLTGKCWNNGSDSIDCWKVTMCTPITLECTDPQPHPVDNNKVCFKVGIDGDDATGKYCNEKDGGEFNQTGDGFCCLSGTKKDFVFKEETEHNLAYYCVDALGNKGPTDDEKFKVGGTNFTIPLYKKWNLISVPFVLLNNNPQEVFSSTPGVESVWAYDGATGEWLVYVPGNLSSTLTSIDPGWGYWVLEGQDKENLMIGGSLFNTRTVPPSKDLVKGWNLIGYYGTNMKLVGNGKTEGNSCGGTKKLGEDVYCALNSLIDTQEGYPRWSSLWTFTNKGNHNTYWEGLETCDPNHLTDQMLAGKGYWIEIDKDDKYAPASTCIWNSDFTCKGNIA